VVSECGAVNEEGRWRFEGEGFRLSVRQEMRVEVPDAHFWWGCEGDGGEVKNRVSGFMYRITRGHSMAVLYDSVLIMMITSRSNCPSIDWGVHRKPCNGYRSNGSLVAG